MKTLTAKRIFIGLAAAFVVVFGVQGAVFAQASVNLADDKLQTIRTRCSNSQFALQQIEKRDAVSRINRGRAYDQMLRQISAFNSRFAYNKVNMPDLVQITSDLQTAVNDFRSSYDTYDNDISSALKVDCKQDPSQYYGYIVQARNDRAAIGDKVKAINDLTTKYRDEITTYQETLK